MADHSTDRCTCGHFRKWHAATNEATGAKVCSCCSCKSFTPARTVLVSRR